MQCISYDIVSEGRGVSASVDRTIKSILAYLKYVSKPVTEPARDILLALLEISQTVLSDQTMPCTKGSAHSGSFITLRELCMRVVNGTELRIA